MVEVAQQHGMRKAEADPEDSQQRAGDRQRDVAAGLSDASAPVSHTDAADTSTIWNWSPKVAAATSPHLAGEPRQRDRVHRRQQPVELVQRDHPEAENSSANAGAAIENDRDRDRDPRQRNQHTCGGTATPALPATTIRRA